VVRGKSTDNFRQVPTELSGHRNLALLPRCYGRPRSVPQPRLLPSLGLASVLLSDGLPVKLSRRSASLMR